MKSHTERILAKMDKLRTSDPEAFELVQLYLDALMTAPKRSRTSAWLGEVARARPWLLGRAVDAVQP